MSIVSIEGGDYPLSKTHGGENMNIDFNQAQGKSISQQLQLAKNALSGKSEAKETKEKQLSQSSNSSLLPTDRLDFDKNPNITKEVTVTQDRKSRRSSSSGGEIEASNGANVSFQFDLFYSLTSKVEAKMGQAGAERFVNLSASVAETFNSSFSLSIDGVGSFMNGTDKSLNISPEVANDFFDAVEALTQQGPEALENFLKKSDAFFNELESNYGELDGAFDTIKEQVQAQAKDFIASVGDAQNKVIGRLKSDQQNVMDLVSERMNGNTAENEKSDKNLIHMSSKPELTATQKDYKEFLGKFLEYANKVKESMFNDLMALKDKNSSSKDSGANNALKSLLDLSA